MQFRWKQFLDTHRVPYVERGPNTKRGNVSVACPFCGDDPSEHMGISIDPRNPVWGCLRNPDHRGRNPARLIMALLRCDASYAARLIDANAPELDAFEKTLEGLLQSTTARPQAPALPPLRDVPYPPAFRRVVSQGYSRHFLEYLRRRGFEPAQVVADKYGLHYALVGSFKWRLILPLIWNTHVAGWTGRSINNAMPRYLTLPPQPEAAKRLDCEPAAIDPQRYVMMQSKVEAGNEALVIVEGPFDWLKVDHYNPDRAITVTCCFGMPKPKQVDLLALAARKYQRVIVMLDRAAYSIASSTAQQIEELSGTRAIAVELSEKDPGDMTADQIKSAILAGMD